MDDYGTPYARQRDRELRLLKRYEAYLGKLTSKDWFRYNEIAFFRANSLTRKGVQPLRAKVIAYREAVMQAREDRRRKKTRARRSR